MGGNSSRASSRADAAATQDLDADEARPSALRLASREDVLAWKARLEGKLAACIAEEAERIATARAEEGLNEKARRKRRRLKRLERQQSQQSSQKKAPKKAPKLTAEEKNIYAAALATATDTVTRCDDGVRELSIMYKLAPKDANEIKRCVAMTASLRSIVIRKHEGGPGRAYRDDIATRVMLAMGRTAGESPSLRSMDVSQCNVGGSRAGGVDRFGKEAPAIDLARISAGSAANLLRGLADSKAKANMEDPLKRLTLRGNNLTSWGYHYRPVGVAMRDLLSGPGRILSVDVSSCELGPDCMAHAVHRGIRGIERLNLSDNHLGGRHEYTFQPHSGGSGGGGGDGDEDASVWVDDTRGIFARAFAKTLAGEPGEFDMAHAPCSLRSLDLSSNRLSTKTVLTLARGLALNSTLRSLSVAFNIKLGDDGATALMEAAGSDVSNLEMLDLRGCGVRAFGIFAAKKLAGKLQSAANAAAAEVGIDDWVEGETQEEHDARERREDEEARQKSAHAKSRNLVVDLSANDVNASRLPKTHGDARVRFVTDSWRHLVGGQTNVATLDQIRNYATGFVISGAKFERQYERRGRLGLHLVSSTACPDVVQQLCSAVVSQTVRGSPSQPKKGNRIAVGSLLTHINGVPTAGMTLAQTIERLKAVRGRKEAWAIPTIPNNFDTLYEEEREAIEKRREAALRDAGDTTLRFMGKLASGPPRLKRRKPGSRRRPGSSGSVGSTDAGIKSRSLDMLASVGATKLSEKQQQMQVERDTKARAEQEKVATLLEAQRKAAAGELPDGWQEAWDDWGTVYYWNLNTGETSWEKPVAVGVGGGGGDEPDQALALLQQLSEENRREEAQEAAERAQNDELELLELEEMLAGAEKEAHAKSAADAERQRREVAAAAGMAAGGGSRHLKDGQDFSNSKRLDAAARQRRKSKKNYVGMHR
jgi:hypothetical protein